MCCCGKANINGTANAYSWDGKSFSTRPVNPPALHEGDELLFDEPGRCGGLDSHSHHLRLVKQRYGGFALLVRHGGGDERLPLGYRGAPIVDVITPLDTNARYWLLLKILSVAQDAARKAAEMTEGTWRKAAAEKRIKTRKQPGRDAVKVWIEPAKAVAP